MDPFRSLSLPLSSSDIDSAHAPPGYRSLTDPDPSGGAPLPSKRRLSLRSSALAARSGRSRPSPSVSGSAGGGGGGQIQLLSIPQLDAIQRTLRILDVRLQHVQNNAKVVLLSFLFYWCNYAHFLLFLLNSPFRGEMFLAKHLG